MKKEKHSDISSRKKSNQKIIDSYDYLSNADLRRTAPV